MSYAEFDHPGIINSVNEMYLSLAQAQHRSAQLGRSAGLDDKQWISQLDETDTINPPIRLDVTSSQLTLKPGEVVASFDDECNILALATKGEVSRTDIAVIDGNKWLYDLKIDRSTTQYFVKRTAYNGQNYEFTIKNPKTVVRMSEILLKNIVDIFDKN